jgi:anaerobic ribonucleoside-triphosphate reductase
MLVFKTDKSYEEYSTAKVKKGICDAYESVNEPCPEVFLSSLINNLFIYDKISSQEIRRQVEEALMTINKKVAKAYIANHHERNEKGKELERKEQFINDYIKASNAATGSKYDSNANVSNKNVVTMGQELYKINNIRQNRYMMQERIASKFSKKLAKQYIQDLDTHIIYRNDETAIPGMPYCVSITMYPFLLDGLTKIGGISVAPTDLKSFCGEFINLVYSVSSQFAGAVATPEFILYMDKFIRKDYGEDYLNRLDHVVEFNRKNRTLEKVIENCFQQVIHSMNMPAGNRGYQCVRADTTQLSTPAGYKYLHELKDGDECYVWKNQTISIERITKLNIHDFDGELIQFKGRNYQQTVTDKHRVLRKKLKGNDYEIKEADQLWGKTHLSLPIGSNGIDREDFPISDSLLKLCVIVLTDGAIDGVKEGDINSGRIRIYKSLNRWGYKEIPLLLEECGIGYTINDNLKNDFGKMCAFCITQTESQLILRQIEHTKKSIPKFFKLLSKRQLDIVIDTWSRMDGNNKSNHQISLQCDNVDIQNDLQEIIFLAGYGSEAYDEIVPKYNGNGTTTTKYVEIFTRKDKRISEFNKIRYKGKVWCPTTDAGVVVFREENKIPYISGNSVFWNVGYFDENYFKGVFGDLVFPDGTKPVWETFSWLQKKFMKWFNEERNKYILTFPVETMALLTDGNDVIDKEYADFTAEMWSEGHSFFCYMSDSPDSLSSCCRLRNQLIQNQDDIHNNNTHQFSMGTTSVATGSKAVITINLNRIIQNAVKECVSDFQLGNQYHLKKSSIKSDILTCIKNNITDVVQRIQKYHASFNDILKDFYAAKMLDIYSAGFIDLKKQFLTVGVNGLTDAAEFLWFEIGVNEDYKEFVNHILETINICNRQAKTRDLMYNTEFIPGENVSAKNYNWDKKDGYFVSNKHIMYSSYFFNPEDDKLSIIDKFRLHGKDFVQYLDGGQALHMNLAQHASFEQYRHLLKVAAQEGTNYFTYNIRNTVCNECGTISKDTLKMCNKCGSENIDYMTRIIGYLKRVSAFSEARQKEEHVRNYNSTNEAV